MTTKPTVFISYSHKDEVWKDRLVSQLAVLEQQGHLDLWDDSRINAGDEWQEDIRESMAAAKAAVLLVSANFLTSKFILSEEVPRLLQRRKEQGLVVFPIIVKPCAWQTVDWLSRMQVRPKNAKPLSSHVGAKRDEAMAEIALETFKQFKTVLPPSAQQKLERPNPQIYIEDADIIEFPCDALVLKYAQGFHGADKLVASRLKRLDISPSPGKYVWLPSKSGIAAKRILFVGVPELYHFGYIQIRELAISSLKILAEEMPDAKHIAMTMHGVGYGLDERESFLAQIAGLLEAFRKKLVPDALERVTIVESDKKRASRLRTILEEYLPPKSLAVNAQAKDRVIPKSVIEAGLKSDNKPLIFVAMSFDEEMEDVYTFGIQGPVNAAGYLCERVDMSSFTGDILARIKSKIEIANLIIADLTGANANVYLEVGYAWGKERPTLLLAKKGDNLNFDVLNQRCIIYKNINDLAKKLEADLISLKPQL